MISIGQNIQAQRKRAIGEINAICGEMRKLFVTSIPGQEMIYIVKENEARSCVAAETPDPFDYPFISQEIGITAPTLYEVAQVILNMAASYRVIGGHIEHVRLGRIAGIEAADTLAAIRAARADFDTDIQALKESLNVA